MTCAEFREIAALYALGGLDEAERAAAEEHLAEKHHEGCFEALQRASRGIEVLAKSLSPIKPDESLWRGIEERIGFGQTPAPAKRWREGVAWALAVAAVLLLLATFGARYRERQQSSTMAEADAAAKSECLRELAAAHAEVNAQRAAIALLQSPTTRLVSLAAPSGTTAYSARALVDLPAAKAMFLSSTLTPRSGRDYELWIIRGKQPKSAGLLRAGASGVVLAQVDPLLLAGGADALAVSLEPRGGSPTGSPTGEILLLGSVPKS